MHRLPLSDDRILQVTVIPETLGPSIQVVYEDPQFLATTNSLEDEEPQAVVMADRILSFPSERTNSATDPRPEWRTALFDQIRSFVPAMNPLLTSAILLGLASVLCLVFWLRSSAPPTAADLLQHAQKAELGTVATNRPGVIYEKVAIRTQRRTIKRTIYRDSQGIRHPRRQRLSPEDEQLKSMLASAGVSWDTPLSVAEFADWRYRSGTTRDLVTRPSPHLLTLTTTPRSNGAVQWESLTVRDTDFHAVERTVELRGSGIVEIAELNYDVLPWGAVNQDWFEPLSGQTAMDAPGILPALAAHVPHVLSNLELDEAELEARLALHQLHADAGERIRLARRAQGIEIKGVVDTDARKHELVARLSQLPHVQTSILSVEELDNQPQSVPSLDVKQPLKVYSVEAQSSPLEQYLREKNQSLDQLAPISQNLLDGALKVQQGQVHFSELQPRFDEADRLPVDMQGKLAELSRNYLTTIIAGLDSNSRALRSLDFEDAGPPPAESVLTDDLSQQIHRYQELCEELITSGTGRTRPAAEIARGLMSESERIRLRVIQLSAAVPPAHD